jgi:hypothetical protein
MRHYSTANMVEKVVGMLGTGDLTEFESNFVMGMERRLKQGTLTGLSERQIEVLEHIHNKHFA